MIRLFFILGLVPFFAGASTCRQDAEAIAKRMRLHYVKSDSLDIRRVGRGKGFSYVNGNNKPVSPAVRARIESLGIPKSWTDVWIHKDPIAHLQAKGDNSRGMTRPHYHPKFLRGTSREKYKHVIEFAGQLPELRAKIAASLKQFEKGELTKERAMAIALRIMDLTAMRIGERKSDEQIKQDRENGRENYGLVALRIKHLVGLTGNQVELGNFKGKSGVWQDYTINDADVAKFMRDSKSVPGYELFQYFDEFGIKRVLSDDDVRDYMQGLIGDEFKPKEFRTWHGSLAAAATLARLPVPTTDEERDANIEKAIQSAREKLGHEDETDTARENYIHPAILEAYEEDPKGFVRHFNNGSERKGMSKPEARLLDFLENL